MNSFIKPKFNMKTAQASLRQMTAGEFREHTLKAIKTQDDSSVTFSNLVVEYQADSDSIVVSFDLKANSTDTEIWSVSPMVMSDALPSGLYAISQLSMGGSDGMVPFGASLMFRNSSFFPVNDAIRGTTVQVGVAGFIWSEESPWGLFSSQTINVAIPA